MLSNNPDGVEIKAKKGADGKPLDGIPFHPYYTVHDIFGVGVFLMIFSAVMFFAPEVRRLLPRVQQLHPGRSAEDAGAHRAGLVLHAVLLDAARDDRPDGQRAVRASSPSAAVLAILRGGFGALAQDRASLVARGRR